MNRVQDVAETNEPQTNRFIFDLFDLGREHRQNLFLTVRWYVFKVAFEPLDALHHAIKIGFLEFGFFCCIFFTVNSF